MKMKHPFVVAVMAVSLSMVLTNAGMNTQLRQDIKNYCATEVSTENWQIKAHITTSGEVSEDTIEKVCEIIQTKVPNEAWNFLCNSGGKLIIVEGDNIKDYIADNYVTDVSDIKQIKGYCPYFKDNGILKKVDIVIAADCLDALEHEFYHALDFSHGYSSSEEFQKIYDDAEDIAKQVFDTEKAVDYYSGEPTEFFAEMSVKYSNEELNGVSSELEKYLSEVLE